MREVTNKSRVPPGGFFRFKDPDSGMVLQHPFFEELERMAVKHRKANNYPVGAKWDEYFEHIVCENTPTADCHESGIGAKALQATRALAKWASSGFKSLTEAQFNARISICQSCQHYSGKTGVLTLHCKLCGCAKLKVGMATEHCPAGKWAAI